VAFAAGFLISANLGSQVKQVKAYDATAIEGNTLQNEYLSKQILQQQKENADLRKQIRELKN
jgi:hypothetical protein